MGNKTRVERKNVGCCYIIYALFISLKSKPADLLLSIAKGKSHFHAVLVLVSPGNIVWKNPDHRRKYAIFIDI